MSVKSFLGWFGKILDAFSDRLLTAGGARWLNCSLPPHGSDPAPGLAITSPSLIVPGSNPGANAAVSGITWEPLAKMAALPRSSDSSACSSRNLKACGDPAAVSGVPAKTVLDNWLVQRTPSAHDPGRCHAGRSLFQSTTQMSATPLGATCRMAARLALCSTQGPDQRPARCPVGIVGRIRRQVSSSASPHSPARGMIQTALPIALPARSSCAVRSTCS